MNLPRALAVVLLGVATAFGQDGRRVALEAPAAETFRLDVELRSLTSLLRGEAAPGVTLEVGVAAENDPYGLLTAPVLASVQTDDDGAAAVSLGVPIRWRADPSARVWARVETPGYQRLTWAYTFQQASADGARELMVRRGGSQFGSVRTPCGDPVAEAEVWLLLEDSDRQFRARTSERGHFVVHFREAGRYQGHVRAGVEGPACGSLALGVLGLDVGTPPDSLELVLQPVARIAGRIMDPDGAPVRGAWVRFVPAGRSETPKARTCAEFEDDGRLFGCALRAGTDGRLEIPGLVLGDYDVYADLRVHGWESGLMKRGSMPSTLAPLGRASSPRFRSRVRPVDPADFVTTISVGPKADALELVHAIHRVEVHVQNAYGESVDFVERSGERGVERSWVRIEGVGAETWMDDDRWPCVVDEYAMFRLKPDRRYTLIWQNPAFPLIERPLRTNAGGPWLSSVNLQLVAPGGPARLEVLVLDPSGAPLDVDDWDEPAVVIRSRLTGRMVTDSLGEWGSAVRDSAWALEIPAGSFTVEGNVEPRTGCMITYPLERAGHAPGYVDLDLEPGESRHVTVRLQHAGHLDFESLRAPSEPTESELSSTTKGKVLRCGESARVALEGGVAILTAPGRDPIEHLTFEISGSLCDTLDWIRPGWSTRCMTPIPPGTWTLRVLGDSGVLFQRDVVVVTNEVTVVRW